MIPVVYSDKFLADYMTVDCENPDRITSIFTEIEDIAQFIEPIPCEVSDLMLCHSEIIIKLVMKNKITYETATLAAGGAIRAAEIALEKPSFALIRPPGHHAGHGFNGGFCFFNNIAIALMNLFSRGFISDALIVDIDLHYGNGTYDIVKDDKRIAFRNIDASSREGFFSQLTEALHDAASFDIVGCSAGFDTYIRDWGSLLFTRDYLEIGDMLASSNPCFFAVLEGGYYIPDLGENVRSFLEGMQKHCL
ncbi:MAG: Acetylpolyamine aminohydrolase [Deltaproteobacteria bacterium ADurb.Bin026]|nr:MAG: Acetylpolyamine aminohydrolase [Deltaproteobacteria bacterium ADurb.Bin026]